MSHRESTITTAPRSFPDHTSAVGHPLPSQMRTKMESAFGADFGHVRIHERSEVLLLGSVACTCGEDIYVAPGRYNPYSQIGQAVLAHELTHVLQQRCGRVPFGLPGSLSVNRDLALEVEATVAAAKVSRGEAVYLPGAGHGEALVTANPPVIQCYTVVLPVGRVPLALLIGNALWNTLDISTDTFIGQEKGGACGFRDSSFLRMGAAGVPTLRSLDPAGVTLRLSANNQMAIEDVDLNTRQPKVFYATQGIINASNARLQLLGSFFRLVPYAAQTITVGANVLVRVTPSNVQVPSAGLTMNCTEPCNQLVGDVMGHNPARLQDPPDVDYETARSLMPIPQPPAMDNTSSANRAVSMANITVPYVGLCLAPTPVFTNLLQQRELNEHANPEVGEGFLMTSLLAPAPGGVVDLATQPVTYRDFYHAAGGLPIVVHKDYMWNSHWAGVVARDGADVITLENYARNRENGALGAAAQEWYFQMYCTNPATLAQTWFGAWGSIALSPIPGPMPAALTPAAPPPTNPPPTHMPLTPGTKGFANPLAVKVAVPDAHYDAVAARLYGGVNIDTIKDAHNLIAGAPDAHQEMLEVLKGLHYANVHLNDGASGRKSRIQAWANALMTALAAPGFRQNLQAIHYASAKIVQLATIS